MAIRYEYNSTCCAHLYIETRNADTVPIVTQCNVCGQGEYVEINQIEIETIDEPVYQAVEESELIMSANDKLIEAGLTQEEILSLIQAYNSESEGV